MRVPETQIASFDVFDTLITRLTESPAQIFNYVEYCAKTRGYREAAGFATRRVQAERSAVSFVGSANLTLDDIYRELAQFFSPELLVILQQIEVDTEVAFCRPVPQAINLLTRSQEAGRDIILISDMYLPAHVIERILEKCGVSFYEKLYVSSEYGKSKRSGALFNVVTQDYHVKPDAVTHYGDDYYSDYLVPRKLGIQAVLLSNGYQASSLSGALSYIKNRINRSRLSRCASRRGSTIDLTRGIEDRGRQIGYSILGPMLVQFCTWLHSRAHTGDSDRLVFIARDGYIIRKCYGMLYPDEQTTYLLISRRSSTVPMLWKNPDIRDLKRTLGLGREIAVEELLTRLGLQPEQFADHLAKHNLTLADRVETAKLASNKRFLSLYDEVQTLVLSNSAEEYEAMVQYFLRLTDNYSSIKLVDLGWRGTIQHTIELLFDSCGISAEVQGFYLGIDPLSEWQNTQLMEGFLFSGHNRRDLAQLENWFNAVLEAMFIAPHPTAERFFLDSDGTPTVQLAAEDTSEHLAEFQEIQQGAIDFVWDFVNDSLDDYLDLDSYNPAARLFQLGLKPSLADAAYLGDCVYSYQESVPLAEPKHGLFFYLVHPKALIGELRICYWKTAFLKRLLPLPIPYYRFLSYTKKIYSRQS